MLRKYLPILGFAALCLPWLASAFTITNETNNKFHYVWVDGCKPTVSGTKGFILEPHSSMSVSFPQDSSDNDCAAGGGPHRGFTSIGLDFVDQNGKPTSRFITFPRIEYLSHSADTFYSVGGRVVNLNNRFSQQALRNQNIFLDVSSYSKAQQIIKSPAKIYQSISGRNLYVRNETGETLYFKQLLANGSGNTGKLIAIPAISAVDGKAQDVGGVIPNWNIGAGDYQIAGQFFNTNQEPLAALMAGMGGSPQAETTGVEAGGGLNYVPNTSMDASDHSWLVQEVVDLDNFGFKQVQSWNNIAGLAVTTFQGHQRNAYTNLLHNNRFFHGNAEAKCDIYAVTAKSNAKRLPFGSCRLYLNVADSQLDYQLVWGPEILKDWTAFPKNVYFEGTNLTQIIEDVKNAGNRDLSASWSAFTAGGVLMAAGVPDFPALSLQGMNIIQHMPSQKSNLTQSYQFKWDLIDGYQGTDKALTDSVPAGAAPGSYVLTITKLPENKTNFAQMVVFGDSLSDTGNLFTLSRGNLPRGVYYNGRFSNGVNWVDQMQTLLGIPVYNYAVGGARVLSEANSDKDEFGLLKLTGFPTVPDLYDQIKAYIKQYPGGLPGKTLYVFLQGGDDFDHFVDTATQGRHLAALSDLSSGGFLKENDLLFEEKNDRDWAEAAANRQSGFWADSAHPGYGAEYLLKQLGASRKDDQFIFLGLPNLNEVPAYNVHVHGHVASTFASIFSKYYNDTLQKDINDLKQQGGYDNFHVIPLENILDYLRKNNAEFGYSDEPWERISGYLSSYDAQHYNAYVNDFNFLGYGSVDGKRNVTMNFDPYNLSYVTKAYFLDFIHPSAKTYSLIGMQLIYDLQQLGINFIKSGDVSSETPVLQAIMMNKGVMGDDAEARATLVSYADTRHQLRPDFSGSTRGNQIAGSYEYGPILTDRCSDSDNSGIFIKAIGLPVSLGAAGKQKITLMVSVANGNSAVKVQQQYTLAQLQQGACYIPADSVLNVPSQYGFTIVDSADGKRLSSVKINGVSYGLAENKLLLDTYFFNTVTLSFTKK